MRCLSQSPFKLDLLYTIINECFFFNGIVLRHLNSISHIFRGTTRSLFVQWNPPDVSLTNGRPPVGTPVETTLIRFPFNKCLEGPLLATCPTALVREPRRSHSTLIQPPPGSNLAPFVGLYQSQTLLGTGFISVFPPSVYLWFRLKNPLRGGGGFGPPWACVQQGNGLF